MGYYDSDDQDEGYELEWLLPNPQRFWFVDNLLYPKMKWRKILADRVTVFVPGQVFWAKIIGAPRPNYEQDGREWSYDFVPDDTTFLKDNKLLDRLKTAKDGMPGDYIRLKKPEFDKEGNKNEPIRIYNNENEAWDDRLLGNGTKVVAKLQIVDWGKGKKQSIYTQALRVEELVSYTSNEFGAYDSKTTAASAPSAKKAPAKGKAGNEFDADLDDDVPF